MLGIKKYFAERAEKKRQAELLRLEMLRKKRKEENIVRLVFSIFILIGIIFYVSYRYNFFKEQKTWITTVQGIKIYDFQHSKEAKYSWNGNKIAGFAHDNGILSIIVNKDTIKRERVNFNLGSLDKNDWITTNNGEYLGEKFSTTPDGFGLLKNGNRILIGNFNDGELEGFIKEYNNNFLVYRGQYKDNNYNGFGTLYKDGEFIYSNWEDGQPYDGFIDEKTKSISRIWDRYLSDENDIEANNKILTKEEFSKLDDVEFKKYLAILLNDYINNRVSDITEKNTNFFSLEPIRMFWQTLFYSKNERINFWFDEFKSNGLSKDDIEFFINSYVNDYNNKNIYKLKLNEIKLSKLDSHNILDDKTYNSLHDMEFAGWSQNVWFDFVLVYITLFIITSLIGIFALPLFGTLKVVDFIVSILVGIFVFILSFILEDIKPEYINIIADNYVTYLLDQNIFNKI